MEQAARWATARTEAAAWPCWTPRASAPWWSPGLLLARPAPPYRALPWYAGTLFLFYFLLGIAGLGGLDLIGAAADLRTTDLGLWVQLIVGAGLVLWGVLSRDTVAGASATGCGASPSG